MLILTYSLQASLGRSSGAMEDYPLERCMLFISSSWRSAFFSAFTLPDCNLTILVRSARACVELLSMFYWNWLKLLYRVDTVLMRRSKHETNTFSLCSLRSRIEFWSSIFFSSKN